MHIAITAASGLIGSELVRALPEYGHTVTPLVRGEAKARRDGAIFWDPYQGVIDADRLEKIDAVVHLSGASLYARWTRRRKRLIWQSRLWSTELLADTLAGLEGPPRVLIQASVVGIYGHRDLLAPADETTPPAFDFLGLLAQDWEEAAAPAEKAGVRVVQMRLAPVLSRRGGPLRMMLPFFRLGLGGWYGPPSHAFSWVALPEIPPIVQHLLEHEEIAGPVNVVAPELPSAREFAKTLGRVLRRPAFVPFPSALMRLTAGDLAREMLLVSGAAEPRRLLETGYVFRYPTVEEGLRAVLGRERLEGVG